MLCRVIFVLSIVVSQCFSSDAVPVFAAHEDRNTQHLPARGKPSFLVQEDQPATNSMKSLDLVNILSDFENVLRNFNWDEAVLKEKYEVRPFKIFILFELILLIGFYTTSGMDE